jgi:hypothetical protein
MLNDDSSKIENRTVYLETSKKVARWITIILSIASVFIVMVDLSISLYYKTFVTSWICLVLASIGCFLLCFHGIFFYTQLLLTFELVIVLSSLIVILPSAISILTFIYGSDVITALHALDWVKYTISMLGIVFIFSFFLFTILIFNLLSNMMYKTMEKISMDGNVYSMVEQFETTTKKPNMERQNLVVMQQSISPQSSITPQEKGLYPSMSGNEIVAPYDIVKLP